MTKISGLDSGTTPDGTEKIAVVQNGTTVRLTAAQIAASKKIKTVTSDYPIVAADTGSIIQAGTGTTGKFTITLPAITGFVSNAVVTVKNGDTARGKMLSGFPSDIFPILFPGQTVVVEIVNGAWATLQNPGLWYTQSTVTFQVDHTLGSNTTADGLGATTGAFATIAYAYKVATMAVLCGVPASFIIIQVNNTSFTETLAFVGGTNSQQGAIFISGNPASPSTRVWNTAGISCDNGAIILLEGFTFRTTGSGFNCVNVNKQGLVVVIDCIWSSAVNGSFINITTGGIFVTDADLLAHQIGDGTSSTFNYFIKNDGGIWNSPGAQAFTVSGAQTFTAWYAGNGSGAITDFGAAQTITGTGAGASSTGLRFALTNGATMDTGAAATTFPGATAGTGLNWTPYTPTATATIGTPTAAPATGQYIQNGKTVTVQASVTVTTVGTAAGAMKITLPSGLTASTTANYVGSCFESAITSKSGAGVIQTSAPTFIYTTDATGTTWWSNGKVVDCTVTYQIP